MVGFDDLYERHWRNVDRFALFLSGNPAPAESSNGAPLCVSVSPW
jgi:hypothetical protein